MEERFSRIFALRLRESEQEPLPAATPRTQRLFQLPGKVDAVIGMRRVGKSWFLLQRMRELQAAGVPRERMLYCDFEDEQIAGLEARHLTLLEEAFYELHPESRGQECWLFLDEIQEVPGWEKFVRRQASHHNLHLAVTGSSAKLLSTEIASSLRGRALTTELLPFSFREALAHRQVEVPSSWPATGPQRSRLRAEFTGFLRDGGFPEVQGLSGEAWRRTLQSYLEIALLRDIAERHGIANLTALRFIVRRLLRCVGSRSSAHALHQDLKSQGITLGKNQVYEFVAHCEDAMLLYFLPIHAGSIRRQQMNPRKVYAVDHGLVRACVASGRDDTGHHLENIVYIELRRRGEVLGYHSTASGREVDFVFRDQQGDLHLIQACAELDSAATRARELLALGEAMGEVTAASACIISLVEEGVETVEGRKVELVPAWRWLAQG